MKSNMKRINKIMNNSLNKKRIKKIFKENHIFMSTIETRLEIPNLLYILSIDSVTYPWTRSAPNSFKTSINSIWCGIFVWSSNLRWSSTHSTALIWPFCRVFHTIVPYLFTPLLCWIMMEEIYEKNLKIFSHNIFTLF